MRGKISVWDNQYYLEGIYWYGDGDIAHVCFKDENELFYVVHPSEDENIEHVKGDPNHELIYADLGKRVLWEESK